MVKKLLLCDCSFNNSAPLPRFVSRQVPLSAASTSHQVKRRPSGTRPSFSPPNWQRMPACPEWGPGEPGFAEVVTNCTAVNDIGRPRGWIRRKERQECSRHMARGDGEGWGLLAGFQTAAMRKPNVNCECST